MKTKIFCDIADFKTIKFYNNKFLVNGFTAIKSYETRGAKTIKIIV